MQRFAQGACQTIRLWPLGRAKSPKNGAKCNKGAFYIVLSVNLRHLSINGTGSGLAKALFLKNLL